jgi:hypothetical protein
MDGVGTAILISEYYPKVLPPADEAPQPVGRLTPFFHDITLEDITAKNAKVAGVIVGLPESPVKGVVLERVSLEAAKGMTIGYAQVKLDDVSVKSAQGDALIKTQGAQVDGSLKP